MVVSLGAAVTVDSIVSLIKLQAVIPNTATLFSSANVASILDDMMRKRVIPLVKSLKEEYWVTNLATQISATQTLYPIPYRAVGHALRDVALQDTSGNLLYLVRYEPEDIKFPMSTFYSPTFSLGYYLQDFNVVLYPPQVSNYTAYQMLMKYERRPSNLILSTSCGQITSFNQGASTITLSFVPTAWTTATTLDIINNLPPFNSVADDVVITAINGLTLTITVPSAFSTTFWTAVAQNYWAAPSMTTPIPQIPYEAFPYLSALGKKALLSGVGDVNMLKEADEDIAEAKVLINSILTPRVEGTPKTLSGNGSIRNYSGGGMF